MPPRAEVIPRCRASPSLVYAPRQQRLGKFTCSLRCLSWTEEARIKVVPGEDASDAALVRALHDIPGLAVPTPDEAWQIIRKITQSLRGRLFVVYPGSLPENRYYLTKGFFQHRITAPSPGGWSTKGDGVAKNPQRRRRQRFSAAEAHEARQLEQTLAAQAAAARKGQGR